jgi:hypothetical protein
MPEQRTKRRAERAKSPSSQAGEYVREEIEHVREGKHGARSPQQAIAIGLSKARRAGVKLPPPPGKRVSKSTSSRRAKPSAKRSRAISRALKREGSRAASHAALSKQARGSARKRGPANRRAAARKAVRTKGAEGRRRAAVKAARTRTRRAA